MLAKGPKLWGLFFFLGGGFLSKTWNNSSFSEVTDDFVKSPRSGKTLVALIEQPKSLSGDR